MTISRAVLTFALALAMAAAACAGASTSPSLAPSRPSTPSAPSGGVVVTFQVGAEQFRIELTDPADIDIARKLLAGEEAPGIPNGVVVRGDPGVNTGYSWHIDPASVEFADVTTEVCDGLPSDVEANQITSDRFCPWNAKVIGIEG
jgi:hypothetical protein